MYIICSEFDYLVWQTSCSIFIFIRDRSGILFLVIHSKHHHSVYLYPMGVLHKASNSNLLSSFGLILNYTSNFYSDSECLIHSSCAEDSFVYISSFLCLQ